MADYKINVLECDLFDTRLRRRHLEKAALDPTALNAHLAGLPDVAEQGEEFVVHLGAGGDEEEEEA